MWSFLFSYSQIHYDDTFNSDTSDVTGYIDSMVTQLQAHMCQISLGTQIKIEVSMILLNSSIIINSEPLNFNLEKKRFSIG